MVSARRTDPERVTAPRKRLRVAASAFFFPAAALHAVLVLPWSVLAITGIATGPASLATPLGHAHEMLVGYALAVVAGNQLGVLSAWRLRILAATWMLARVAYVAFSGPIAWVLDIAFAAALAVHVVPRLFRAAKKLRNQALPAILTALCVGVVAFDLAAILAGTATMHAIVTAVVLLLAALMLFMGGRIIAPAAAGQLYRQGVSLAARVQPRIEAGIIAAMAVAVVAAVTPDVVLVLRLACATAGALAVVRLLRWRLWTCTGRFDLQCLGVGYAWLAAGLAAIAIAGTGSFRTAALHVVTVGALGTLTFNVMANTMLVRARRSPADEPRLVWGTALIGLATACRVAAAFVPGRSIELLAAAAACWSGAFFVLIVLLADALLAPKTRPASEPLSDSGRGGSANT
jgi:uncharacterized protein involved in response to NO